MKKHTITLIDINGNEEIIGHAKTDLEVLTELRSVAFDLANSGKHGEYPYDETFNDEVEDGFSADGGMWVAKDGTIVCVD